MDEQDRLQQQMASIGTRYIARTLGEMARMRDLLESALGGAAGTMRDLEHLAHKIHGSGAMFGFDLLSDHAAEVEHLAGFIAKGEGPDEYKILTQEELQTRLRAGVTRLDEVTRAAAKDRGIELNAS